MPVKNMEECVGHDKHVSDTHISKHWLLLAFFLSPEFCLRPPAPRPVLIRSETPICPDGLSSRVLLVGKLSGTAGTEFFLPGPPCLVDRCLFIVLTTLYLKYFITRQKLWNLLPGPGTRQGPNTYLLSE